MHFSQKVKKVSEGIRPPRLQSSLAASGDAKTVARRSLGEGGPAWPFDAFSDELRLGRPLRFRIADFGYRIEVTGATNPLLFPQSEIRNPEILRGLFAIHPQFLFSSPEFCFLVVLKWEMLQGERKR